MDSGLTVSFAGGCVLLGSALVLGQMERELVPARIASGHTPAQPPLASQGGLTVLDAEVSATGVVAAVETLLDGPPFTSELESAVWLWRFLPAEKGERAVASRVVVVGLFRPPALVSGDEVLTVPARPVADAIPYPTSVVTPRFPPRALEDGVVLMELEVSEDGDVSSTSIVQSSLPFDEPARQAAEQFRFRPAKSDGHAVRSFAIVVFGFRQPVTQPRPRR